MNKMSTLEEIMKSVKDNPWTMLAVDIDGNIRNCVGLQEIPEPLDEFNRIVKNESHKGCSVSFVRRDKNATEAKIKRKVQESVDSLKYAKTHDLKPGINIPETESKGIKKLWWEIKKFMYIIKARIR